MGNGMSNPIEWFAEHPRSVGETYAEHFRAAARFGLAMVSGGAACLAHAFVPALFERTGSRTVKRLYAEMAARQPGHPKPAHEDPRWRPEYEI
jgi:hypothetical protein